MFFPKLATLVKPGSPLRRASDPDPSLRYRIACNAAELQQIAEAEPEVAAARIGEVPGGVSYPLLLESWDGGLCWGNQLQLEAALASDWEAA